MAAELFVESGVPPMSWDDFVLSYPPSSIALDGFVIGGPNYSPQGPYLSANHHEGVARLATLSSAQQIARYLRMGMTKAFDSNGEFAASVYVNDCDEDVCTAWWLLSNDRLATDSHNPRLDHFLEVAGTLDATAGSYPYDPTLPILGEIAWMFEPFRQFRASKEMARKDDDQYKAVIETVAARIGRHVIGKGESIQPNTTYKVIGGGEQWKMIEEVGAEGRIGAFYDGITAYVIVQEEVADVRWRYTVGKCSDFVPFDVPGILERLNEIENCKEDRWGGSPIIGGSPRVAGSRLTPDKVEEIINWQIAETARTK